MSRGILQGGAEAKKFRPVCVLEIQILHCGLGQTDLSLRRIRVPIIAIELIKTQPQFNRIEHPFGHSFRYIAERKLVFADCVLGTVLQAGYLPTHRMQTVIVGINSLSPL